MGFVCSGTNPRRMDGSGAGRVAQKQGCLWGTREPVARVRACVCARVCLYVHLCGFSCSETKHEQGGQPCPRPCFRVGVEKAQE